MEWVLLRPSDVNVESVMSTMVHVCRSSQTAQVAIHLMRAHDCGCIPVVNHGAVVGIVTDRDIAAAAAESDKLPSELPLWQIMSDEVLVARPEMPISEAEAVMRGWRIRRMPVVDQGDRPIGILSLDDIARASDT